MISWPAAKQIRCVNPSIATVSPSRTCSAIASCRVPTLSGIRRPAVVGAAQHTELVSLGVVHDRPEAPALVDAAEHGRAGDDETIHLVLHRAGRADVEMQAVLHALALGDDLEQERPAPAGGIDDLRLAVGRLLQVVTER